LLIATCTATTLALAAAGAWAQQYQDPAQRSTPPGQPPAGQGQYGAPPQSAPGVDIDDENLAQFRDAFSHVQEIREEFVQEANDLDDPAQVTELQQQAQERMVQAVRSTGLSVSEYNAIATQMKTDPALRDKVERGM
jgi:hypothetical protein